MGRLRIKPKMSKAELMPIIIALRAQGASHAAIALEVECATSTVQKWLWAEKRDGMHDWDERRTPPEHEPKP